MWWLRDQSYAELSRADRIGPQVWATKRPLRLVVKMGSSGSIGDASQPWWKHWTLARCFTVQLIVAPLFISPFYNNSHDTLHPYLGLCAFIFGPVIYCALLSFLRLRNLFGSSPRVRRSLTLVATWAGMLYGLLFCALAWGPNAIFVIWRQAGSFLQDVGQMSQRDWFSQWAWRVIGEPVLMIGLTLLHYAILGAASGIVAAVVFRASRWHKAGEDYDGETQRIPTEL